LTEQKTRLAFEILARENSRMLMVYLRSLIRDEAIIDDLFQESMIVAWQKLDECDRERPFGPWLRGIASRIVMAHYRKQKTIPLAMQESVLSVVDRHFEAINMLAGDTWDDKLAALHECVDALPAHQMDVIRGRYFDGLPIRMIAGRLNMSVEACKKRLQRGRMMLAECLKKKGVLSAAEVAS
jgi:RNA polymerase sigma-70 factor (ECF subfamily)